MKKILIVAPKVLDDEQKKLFKEAGYIVVETTKPEKFKVIDDFTDVERDVVLACALEALSWGNDSTCRNKFGELIRKQLAKKLNIDPTKF